MTFDDLYNRVQTYIEHKSKQTNKNQKPSNHQYTNEKNRNRNNYILHQYTSKPKNHQKTQKQKNLQIASIHQKENHTTMHFLTDQLTHHNTPN